MFVCQPDRLRPARFDRENAGADQIEPGELQERGVAGLSDDAIVGLAALIARQQSSRGFRAMSLEREPAYDRTIGNRYEQLGLLPRRAGVAHTDLHHRRGDLLADDDPDRHPCDLQGRRSPESVRSRLRYDHVRRPRPPAVGLCRTVPPTAATASRNAKKHRAFMMFALR